MKHTGERIYLEYLNETVFEHVHRYYFAGKFVKDKIVLDVACGSGYGSNYLAQFAYKVYGLDKDEETIQENKIKYQQDNLEFITGNAEQLPFADKTFDIVVSFETIEHLYDYEKFLKEVKRVLKDDGILIISTPNKEFSEFQKLKNQYHLKEFYEKEFYDILQQYFKNLETYYQTSGFLGCIIPSNLKITNVEMLDFNLECLRENIIMQTTNSLWFKKYFLLIASNSNYAKNQYSSITNANNQLKIYEQQLNEVIIKYEDLINAIYKSKTYRMGKFIITPIKFFKLFRKKSK